MISVDSISQTFDPLDGPVLQDICFDVEDHQTLSIIGPSGCGKTTLLYILAGLIHPTAGRASIPAPRNDQAGGIAFVLQDYGLFPWKTVYQNIELGMKLRKIPRRIRQDTVNRLLQEMELAGLGFRFPSRLSGGQQQRVAIARALAIDPDILLMDEPFSSLDAMTREHLQNLMIDIWNRTRLSFLIVTHSVEEAVFLGRRILVMGGQPGRIQTVVDNPGFGSPAFRMKPGFFECQKQVRTALESLR
jgi:NitT/TauT family transport system ATP-binding protein